MAVRSAHARYALPEPWVGYLLAAERRHTSIPRWPVFSRGQIWSRKVPSMASGPKGAPESRAQSTSTWDTSASDIEQGWDKAKGKSGMAWQDAKEAVRDGWNRVEEAMPGDADGDGR